MLKSYWKVVVVAVGGGGLQDFSVSPRVLGFGFLGFWVWGLGVWGLGLTIGPGVDNVRPKACFKYRSSFKIGKGHVHDQCLLSITLL